MREPQLAAGGVPGAQAAGVRGGGGGAASICILQNTHLQCATGPSRAPGARSVGVR